MTAHTPNRALGSLSLAAILSLAIALCVSTACSSSKAKETPEERAVTGLTTYQADIRRVVKDGKRADQLVELSSEFQKVVEEAARNSAAFHAKAVRLNADYGAALAEFEALFAEQDKQRAELVEKAVALRTQMAALTTDAEWAELKKACIAEWQAELLEVQS